MLSLVVSCANRDQPTNSNISVERMRLICAVHSRGWLDPKSNRISFPIVQFSMKAPFASVKPVFSFDHFVFLSGKNRFFDYERFVMGYRKTAPKSGRSVLSAYRPPEKPVEI